MEKDNLRLSSESLLNMGGVMIRKDLEPFLKQKITDVFDRMIETGIIDHELKKALAKQENTFMPLEGLLNNHENIGTKMSWEMFASILTGFFVLLSFSFFCFLLETVLGKTRVNKL